VILFLVTYCKRRQPDCQLVEEYRCEVNSMHTFRVYELVLWKVVLIQLRYVS